MFTKYRTEAFIFNKKDFLETDRFFYVFSKDFGFLELLAKGERKINSKLRNCLEVFYLSNIEFVQGKKYKTITGCEIINNFSFIKKSFQKLKISFKISQLLKDFLKFEEEDKKIFDLIVSTFNKLNEKNDDILKEEMIYQFFFWKFLSILGYKPEINNCLICQKKLTSEMKYFYFSEKEGGIICKKCFLKLKDKTKTMKVNKEILAILNLILKENNFSKLEKIKINKKQISDLNKISLKFYSFVLENLL